MGSKYEFKPDKNPPVGGYFTERAFSATLPRVRSAIIRENVSTYRRPDENLPGPNKYTDHLIPFG